jgi:flagellar basal body-associated protein FliL
MSVEDYCAETKHSDVCGGSMTVVESKSESKSEPKSEQASSDMKSEKPAENDSLIIIISLVVVVGLVAGILVVRKMGNKQEAYNDADADLEMSVNRWSESINTTFNPIGNKRPSVAVAIQQQ